MALEDSVNNLVTQTTALLNTVNVAKSTLDDSVASASASATAAAASYDQFDDRYLGPKSANPSLDNDNNALLEGAIYWNTTADEFRVWNGSTWQADTIVGGTVASLNTTGSLQEGSVDVVVQTDIGTAPNEIPLNQYLGSMAYQDLESVVVGDLQADGTVDITGDTSLGNLAYTGTLTGSTGVINIGSGQVYKDASGNVGIGTSAPATSLHVRAVGGGVATFQDPISSATARIGVVGAGGNLTYDSNAGGSHKFEVGGTERLRIDSSGNLIQRVNTTAATLTTNQTLTFSIVDNSTLRISVRGSDGTTRTATLPLL